RPAPGSELQRPPSKETRAHWLAKGEPAGTPAGPIYSIPEAQADPHAQARGMVQELVHPQAGRVKTLGNPVKPRPPPAAVGAAPPLRGADPDAVLAGLGYAASEIASLHARKVV